MSTTHPGESAFTRPSSENDWGKDPGAPGLNKREYFAACALQGFCSTTVSDDEMKRAGGAGEYRKHFAATAVRYADALIAALNEVTP